MPHRLHLRFSGQTQDVHASAALLGYDVDRDMRYAYMYLLFQSLYTFPTGCDLPSRNCDIYTMPDIVTCSSHWVSLGIRIHSHRPGRYD